MKYVCTRGTACFGLRYLLTLSLLFPTGAIFPERGRDARVSVDGEDPIEVVDADPAWAAQGEAAAAEVRAALGPWVVDVEHIGSTAVPGLAAKPVIDLLVGVRSLDDSPAIVTAVTGLGYEYVPELEDELPEPPLLPPLHRRRAYPPDPPGRAHRPRVVGPPRRLPGLAAGPRPTTGTPTPS